MTTLVILAASFANGEALMRHASFFDAFEDLTPDGVHVIPPGFVMLVPRMLPGDAEITGRLVIRRTDRWTGDDPAVNALRALAVKLRKRGIPVADPAGILGIESLERPESFYTLRKVPGTAPTGTRTGLPQRPRRATGKAPG